MLWFILYMGQNLQDGKKVLWMVIIKPHSETCPVQTIHPTDLGLLPSWKSIVCAPAQRFPTFWDARKRVQERFPVSCYSRKSEFVKLQCNPNDYIKGRFGCPKSYCYINLYPSDDPWTLWHVSWAYWSISWTSFDGNIDILPTDHWTDLWLNINVSIKRTPGNESIYQGNVSRRRSRRSWRSRKSAWGSRKVD